MFRNIQFNSQIIQRVNVILFNELNDQLYVLIVLNIKFLLKLLFSDRNKVLYKLI